MFNKDYFFSFEITSRRDSEDVAEVGSGILGASLSESPSRIIDDLERRMMREFEHRMTRSKVIAKVAAKAHDKLPKAKQDAKARKAMDKIQDFEIANYSFRLIAFNRV